MGTHASIAVTNSKGQHFCGEVTMDGHWLGEEWPAIALDIVKRGDPQQPEWLIMDLLDTDCETLEEREREHVTYLHVDFRNRVIGTDSFSTLEGYKQSLQDRMAQEQARFGRSMSLEMDEEEEAEYQEWFQTISAPLQELAGLGWRFQHQEDCPPGLACNSQGIKYPGLDISPPYREHPIENPFTPGSTYFKLAFDDER